jgi:hypothetical protein
MKNNFLSLFPFSSSLNFLAFGLFSNLGLIKENTKE